MSAGSVRRPLSMKVSSLGVYRHAKAHLGTCVPKQEAKEKFMTSHLNASKSIERVSI